MVKILLLNNKDQYITLLNYSAAPFPWCGRSPAELLMGRQIRTKLTQTKENLIPTWHYLDIFQRKNDREKIKQNFDCRHRVHSLPVLTETLLSGSLQVQDKFLAIQSSS